MNYHKNQKKLNSWNKIELFSSHLISIEICFSFSDRSAMISISEKKLPEKKASYNNLRVLGECPFKGTVRVVSCDLTIKGRYFRFTTVP